MKWYNAIGQGMGDTLLFANESGGYTVADRGTWLAMQDKLPNLTIVVGGANLAENKDKALLNPYGVLAVNPDKHPKVKYDLAMHFAEWLALEGNPDDDRRLRRGRIRPAALLPGFGRVQVDQRGHREESARMGNLHPGRPTGTAQGRIGGLRGHRPQEGTAWERTIGPAQR